MSVTISNCPYIFHDTEELSEFLLHCGKYLRWFDGQDVFVNGEYVLTIRVYWSQHAFCEYISYQKKKKLSVLNSENCLFAFNNFSTFKYWILMDFSPLKIATMLRNKGSGTLSRKR